jgi:PKD repeat protein
MNVLKYRGNYVGINLIFFFLLLTFYPLLLHSQTAIPQSCSDDQSWIARWTISSIIGPGTAGDITSLVADGSTYTNFQSTTSAPWIFDIDFGIVRKFTGLKIYTTSVINAPRSYEILVRADNSDPYVSIQKGIIPFPTSGKDNLITLGGFASNYYNAKNVRIIFSDSWASDGSFSSTNPLTIYEMNFFQCGVDPLIAKPIPSAVVPAPALSCAEGISGNIQGVINTYFPGTSDATKGNTSITVDISKVKGANHTLVAGDRVLIIQMQNALMSEANSMAYGDGIDKDLIASGWMNVRNTGEYEFAVVESVSGNTMQLTQPLQKSYSVNGVFQVVYSPVYDNVTLNGLVTASPWDGYCGGIVTFDAKTLDLNNQTIDVSGQGFRGGKMNSNLDTPNIQYYFNIYATDNNLMFGEKGEGIAGAPRGTYATSATRLYSPANSSATNGGSYARGAPGNAGGGGNDHNSGGGGGANIGSGGQGGASWGNITNNSDMTAYWNGVLVDGGYNPNNNQGFVPNGGMGGTGCGTPDPFRIWMGGAGGGGHQNNYAATGGANGGGIILATARTVKGTGNFFANGESAANTLYGVVVNGVQVYGNDGAGGGGAGGTIVFGSTDQTGASINYSVSGGKGGDVTYTGGPHGPGGGGGGGAIIVSTSPTRYNTDGGINGKYLLTGSPWGANKGQSGKIITSNQLSVLYTYPCDHGDAPTSFLDAAHQIKDKTPFLGLIPGDAEPMALNQPPHDKDAKGDDLNGTADEDGVDQPFDLISTAQSIYKVNVTVSNPQNTNVYLCGWIDFNGNGKFEDKEKVSLSGVLSGKQILKWTNIPSDITGGLSYARFRISTDTIALKPTGVAPDGEVEDYTIYINGIPQAVPDTVCTHSGLTGIFYVVKNDNINGDKLGTVSIMTPPAHGTAVVNNNNTPDDKSDDYIVYTPNSGFMGVDSLYYEICNSVGDCAKAKVTITVKEPITVDFTSQPDQGCTPLKVNFINNSSDKSAQFTWDLGDSTTSTNVDPTHTFTTKDKPTVYTVKLTMNTGCGIIDTTKQITVYPLPLAVMTETSNEDKPEVVNFEDVSTTSVRRIWKIDGITQPETDKIFTHTFQTAGNYSISLTVFNEFNCSDDTVIVHHTVFRDLYVPNAFMPNSRDTLVNKFKPVGYGLKQYSFMIFDMWGNLIWSTNKIDQLMPQEGWDGTKNGKPLPNGAYIWRIKAIFENNKVWKGMLKYENGKLINGTYHTEGTVTIIR